MQTTAFRAALVILASLSLAAARPPARDSAKASASVSVSAQADPFLKGQTKAAKQKLRAEGRLATLQRKGRPYDPADLLKAQKRMRAMRVHPSAWPSGTSDPGLLTAPGAAANLPERWALLGPRNPAVLYAGAVSGGIWKTEDAGLNWRPLDDFLPNLIVSAMAMDPRNPQVLYAGTGEVRRGAGIFKSTDGGTTWSRLPASVNESFREVRRLKVSPADGRVLLVAADGGVFRSEDAGATFEMVIPQGAYDVDFFPDGLGAVAATNAQAAYWSGDGGVTWTAAEGLPGVWYNRTELAVSRSDPRIVYASVDLNQGDLYRSSDGGRTFTLRHRGLNPLWIVGFWANTLWVDPTDPERLLWAGEHAHRSLDGGHTWERATQGGIHVDHHVFVEATGFSATNRAVWGANDGGVWRTEDYLDLQGSSPWLPRNTDYATVQFYSGAGHAASGFLVGGTQDNGTLLSTGSTIGWRELNPGDGVPVAVDPRAEPDGSLWVYGGFQHGGTWRVKLGRDGATLANDWFFANHTADRMSYLFTHPQVLDTSGTQRLYKGGRVLWRLDDPGTARSGVDWRVASPEGARISAIAVSPGHPGRIWIGREDGVVQRTLDGLVESPTWARRGEVVLPEAPVTRITVDPARPERVYATFGGFGPDNIQRSEDGGDAWSDITADLPDVPVRSLVVHPFDSDRLYVGTEIGIFASADRGASWSPGNEGPANVSVDELFWTGNRLVAATHGRGMFSLTVNTPPTVAITAPAEGASFPERSHITLTASATDPDGAVVRVEFLRGSTLIGQDTAAPFACVWSDAPEGTHALTARAVDNDGGARVSSAITVTVTAVPGAFLLPAADAHVRDGSYAGANFGAAPTLQVKTHASAGMNRDAYLRFDLGGLSGFLASARLRALGRLNQSGPMAVAVHAVAATPWEEVALAWANRPALGAGLATRDLTGTADAWHGWDVTAHLRKLRARGLTTATLALHAPVAGDPLTAFYAREDALSTNRPRLVYTLVHPEALLVVGNAALAPGDEAVRARLAAMGFAVAIKDDAEAMAADASGKALVLISATVAPAAVAGRFRNVGAPVINWDPGLQDDLGLTPSVTGDFGTVAGQTQVQILAAGHPLAGGLAAGTATVATAAGAFTFGKPAAAAARVGAVVGNEARLLVYGYEKGAAMAGLAAPARRVNLFLGDATAASLTQAGWALFDAAVYWAAGY